MKIRELITEASRDQVANLQQYLNNKGAKLTVDGIMGPRTRAAIQQMLKGDGNFLQTGFGVATDDSGFPIMTGQADNIAGTKPTKPAPAAQTKPGVDKEISGVVKAGPGFTDVQTSDGEIQRRQGARPWRNNNPGNVSAGSYARSKGAVGSDGRFAVFPTLDLGMDAKRDLIFGPHYINLSIRDAISKYAPPVENNTALYIQKVTQATGTTPETKVSDLNNTQREQFLKTISQVEGFKVGTITTIQPAGTGGVA